MLYLRGYNVISYPRQNSDTHTRMTAQEKIVLDQTNGREKLGILIDVKQNCWQAISLVKRLWLADASNNELNFSNKGFCIRRCA